MMVRATRQLLLLAVQADPRCVGQRLVAGSQLDLQAVPVDVSTTQGLQLRQLGAAPGVIGVSRGATPDQADARPGLGPQPAAPGFDPGRIGRQVAWCGR